MRITATLTAALFSLTAMTASAYAQNEPIVPGSESSTEAMEEETRDDVQNNTGDTTAAPVEPGDEIPPGSSEGNVELEEAETRDDIAEGTDAMGTTTVGDASDMESGAMDNADNPSAEESAEETDSPMEMQDAN